MNVVSRWHPRNFTILDAGAEGKHLFDQGY
jgi:hypothetical protein